MSYGVGSSSVVFAALNEVTITGSNAAGDDVTGSGDDATVDLGASVNHVDFYNDGSTTATISNGSETRNIPANSGRLCEFAAAAQSFAVTAPGSWIATPMR